MAFTRLPTFFLSHGGGPWPYMKDQTGSIYDELERSLRAIPGRLPLRPRAVLMISAHWEESEFTVQSSPKPPMLYDYHGFPEHTYQIQYPAPGSPELAAKVKSMIETAGFDARLDPSRGFDHGMFVPMAVIFPAADMPTVQLSLRHDLDPQAHFDLGRALAPLRDQGVLIVGSGLSYHNLRRFGPAGKKASAEFDQWLGSTLAERDARLRREVLLGWRSAPSALLAHPREEHLIPLMAALGAAEGELAESIYHQEDFFGGIVVSGFAFGTLG